MVVRRLLAVDGSGTLSALHVRIAAELAGVSERTVWRWLADGRRGHVEARPRQDGFSLSDALWEVLAQAGGNVAELRRRMLRAQEEGALEGWGAESVPSLPTLHRVIKRDLGAGRVLEVARPAGARVGLEPSRYDRALADLGLMDGAGGPLVVDGPPADAPVPDGAADAGVRGGGVRLYVPGARLVSTRQVAGVSEAVGHTVAARGMCCLYGDTGLGKTVAVEQALHLLPGRVPVWRAVAGVAPGLPQLRASRRAGEQAADVGGGVSFGQRVQGRVVEFVGCRYQLAQEARGGASAQPGQDGVGVGSVGEYRSERLQGRIEGGSVE
ncbi:hypothetical protein GCM10010304_83010 [Streptomyces roseoviolaceus]